MPFQVAALPLQSTERKVMFITRPPFAVLLKAACLHQTIRVALVLNLSLRWPDLHALLRYSGCNLAVDVTWKYLNFFMSDDKKLKQIENEYGSGRMLVGEAKAVLIKVHLCSSSNDVHATLLSMLTYFCTCEGFSFPCCVCKQLASMCDCRYCKTL